MAPPEVRWWRKGVLFGVLCGALLVPVQLSQPPDPDLFGSLLVGLIIALVGTVFFGMFFSKLLHRKPDTRRILFGVMLMAMLILLVYGGIALPLSRNLAFSLRVAAPRAMYVLVLGLILLQLVKTEEVRQLGGTNSMSE
jgi:uncharacterized membrane protein (DUF4010 family)